MASGLHDVGHDLVGAPLLGCRPGAEAGVGDRVHRRADLVDDLGRRELGALCREVAPDPDLLVRHGLTSTGPPARAPLVRSFYGSGWWRRTSRGSDPSSPSSPTPSAPRPPESGSAP